MTHRELINRLRLWAARRGCERPELLDAAADALERADRQAVAAIEAHQLLKLWAVTSPWRLTADGTWRCAYCASPQDRHQHTASCLWWRTAIRYTPDAS